jgi:hypothetical protein
MSNDGGVTTSTLHPKLLPDRKNLAQPGLSVEAVLSGGRLFNIHVGSNPIVWRCRVALAGQVFGEKYVARTESHTGPVAESDIDHPR